MDVIDGYETAGGSEYTFEAKGITGTQGYRHFANGQEVDGA